MLVHFRRSFDELTGASSRCRALPLAPFLEPTTSYLSVVELGMYEMTAQIHGASRRRAWSPASAELKQAFDAEMEQQRRSHARRASSRRCRRAATSASIP